MKIRGLYYGWVIVAVVFLSSVASAAQQNPTIGVFLKPITEDFGWSRSTIAGAVAIGTLAGGFIAVGVGPIIDRFGARWILFVSFLVAGLASISIGHINALWQLYAAIFMSRVALQGVINLTNQTVVAKWFVKSRGRAMAIASLGQRIGGGVIPFVAQQIISLSNWRTASISVGVIVMGLTLAPVATWLRRQPQDMGLQPDGIPLATKGNEGNTQSPVQLEKNFTLKEAIRSRPFWVITAALCLTNFVNTGINFNLIAHMTDSGLSNGQAATIVLVWALIGVPGTFYTGLLAEKYSLRIIMILLTFGVTSGILLFIHINNMAIGILFAIIHGGCFAGSLLILQILLADYYGSKSLGALRGLTTPMQMVANAIGPLSAALVFDTTGSYSPILWADVLLQMLVVLSLWFLLPSISRWETDNARKESQE